MSLPPPPVRRNSIRVRRVSMLALFAAAFAELPTRIKEENAEMWREEEEGGGRKGGMWERDRESARGKEGESLT